MTYDKFVDNWDDISSVFSRSAVLKGSFDEYADSSKKKRGTAEVDNAFLDEIEHWRDNIARNLALRNSSLNVRDINYAVQKTIDRLIFLRICEDRGSEDYGRLQALLKGDGIYARLIDIFKDADDRYNSGLFHFGSERNRLGAPDTLTPSLSLDDKVLKQIFKNIYYPDSPYEFSVLPADILGQIYEQFLGKTIVLTKSHRAKIEDKPEVRKSGGVYYTPKYIVDFMVENTLGRILNGPNPKKPKPLSLTKAANVKLLDPACGSGSFLIVAYQYLLDWYRDQYTLDPQTNELDPGKLRRYGGGKGPMVYEAPGGEYKLTTTERKRILLNNIHGVDVDSQAVEVTKLSLLLKVLEGETQQVLQRDFVQERQRILPDLGRNIQCGNSIIGPDFYDQADLPNITDDERYRINVLDWGAAFPKVFQDGGFDCVIGNPPYVDIKEHPAAEVGYIFDKYKCANNRINLFSTFVEKALALVNDKSAYFSMIVPTAILAQASYTELRRQIIQNTSLTSIVRLPNESFGSAAGEVKVDTVIVTWTKPSKSRKQFDVIAYRGYERISSIQETTAHIVGPQDISAISQEPDFIWSVGTTEEHAAVLKKVETAGRPLVDYVDFCLGLTPYDKHRGHTPDQIKGKIFHADHQKDETFRKLLRGNDVRRYHVEWNGEHWISYGKWLGAPREQKFFKDRRILVKQIIDWTSLRIWATVTDEELYNSQNAFNLLQSGPLDLYYILGLVNSKLLNFYHTKKFLDEFKMRFQKILIKDCKRFPIRPIDFSDVREREKYERIIDLVKSMLDLHRELASEKNPETLRHLGSRATNTDKQIDRLVYELYELNDKEIAVVEQHANHDSQLSSG